jgi:hypothetical protein
MLANLHVVGNLHQIVDLGPARRMMVSASAPRSMVVLAPLRHHPQDGASGLRNLEPLILGPGQAKAIGADHAARMHGNAVTQHAAVVNRDIGIKHHIIAQHGASTNHHARMQDAALANHGTGTDADVFAHFAAGGNHAPSPITALA